MNIHLKTICNMLRDTLVLLLVAFVVGVAILVLVHYPYLFLGVGLGVGVVAWYILELQRVKHAKEVDNEDVVL